MEVFLTKSFLTEFHIFPFLYPFCSSCFFLIRSHPFCLQTNVTFSYASLQHPPPPPILRDPWPALEVLRARRAVSRPEAHRAPRARLHSFPLPSFLSFFLSILSFGVGPNGFRFCALSFQASWTLILHLPDADSGPECPQMAPSAPCKPSFYMTL